MVNKKKCIWLSQSTIARLKKAGTKEDTYDSLINKLLFVYKKVKENKIKKELAAGEVNE